MEYAKSPNDIPVGEHFAILCCKSLYVPGDERSRTNPGHGYPAHSVESWEYLVFNNREEWERSIESRILTNKDFVPIHAFRPKTESKVVVGQTWPSYTPKQ